MMRRPGGFPGAAAGAADPVDHCFALLFLARATARSIGTVTERSLIDMSKGNTLSDRENANLFKAAWGEMTRLSGDAAKARAQDFALLGPRVIPYLLPMLHDPDETKRARSVLVLRAITGKDFGYDPAAPASEREKATDGWTAWFLMNKAKLRLDRAARLIR